MADKSSVDPQAIWEKSIQLQASFNKKHQEIAKVRDIVRLRVSPVQLMPGKWLMTARNAMGWAIISQFMSFFDMKTMRIEVQGDALSRKEYERTTKNEQWLRGSSETVNRNNKFVERAAMYFGLETGDMILGAAFDPWLAKNGRFPIEVIAPDPYNCAYIDSTRGLTDFVTEEIKTVGAVKEELEGSLRRSKTKDLIFPDKLLDNKPTMLVTDTRYFTKSHEVRFIDGEHVYSRKHFMGRVPFDVAHLNHVPSDRPEEMGFGIISPVRDLLDSFQQLMDIHANDAELGQRPLGILFTGNKYEIVQVSPGEEYAIENSQTASLTPVPYNPNHQLLRELADMLMQQIDTAALPRSVYSGPQFQLSGYAADTMMSGIKAKVNNIKEYPEIMLSNHFGLRLQVVKHFGTTEMARSISPDDTEKYLNSFNVTGYEDSEKKGTQKRRVWWNLTADDVDDNPYVFVDITANLPAEKSAQMQRAEAALKMGMPFEYVMREVYEANDVDEILKQRDFEMLLGGNEMFKDAYMQYIQEKYVEQNKEFGKFYLKWLQGQGLMDDPNAPPQEPQAPQAQGGLPPELNFQTLDEMAQQGDPQAMGQSAPQLPPMPPPDPQMMRQGGGPLPNQLTAQALQGMMQNDAPIVA